MDGLTSLMQGARAQQPMQQQPMQQQPMQQPMQGMNPAMSNAIEVVNNDVENLNLDPRTEYALKIQEASDLLKAAERNLAMSQPQPTPPEVIGQRKQQVQQQLQGGIGGLLQQLTPGMQQRGMQMAAAAAPQMQGGLPTQSAPNMVNMGQGGIIGYAEGGEVYDDIGAMAALHKQASDKMSDPNANIQEKANAQQQINMIKAQAGDRYGQVMRRVDEMRGLPPLEMAMGGQVKRYKAGDLVTSDEDPMFLPPGQNWQDQRIADLNRGRYEASPEGQAEQAELAFEARRDLVTRARNLRSRMEAEEISQDAYNRDVRQIERELSNLTDINRSMQVPEVPEERMPVITPADASAELTRQLTRERVLADSARRSAGRSIGEQFAGPRAGIMGGMPNLSRAEEPMLLPPNRQDQRIADLRTRAQEEGDGTYEDIANFLRSRRDYVVENPLDAAGYALLAVPGLGVGGRLLSWGTKLLTKYPSVSTTLLGLGLINREEIGDILTGEMELPSEALEALVSTDLTQAGVDPTDIAEGRDIVASEEVAAPEEVASEEVADPEEEEEEEEVVTETTGDGTSRERQFNLDNLISGLLAAGNATSTSQALRGYGVGSQAETQRQEGIAREERENRLLAQNRLNELETQYRLRAAELTRELAANMNQEQFKAAQTIMENINSRMDLDFEALVATEAERILKGTGFFGRATGEDREQAEQRARLNLIDDYVFGKTGYRIGATPTPPPTPTATAEEIIADAEEVAEATSSSEG